MFFRDSSFLCLQHGSHDFLPKLAHVARPCVGQQRFSGSESVFSPEKESGNNRESKDCCGTLIKTYGRTANWVTYVLQLQRGEQFDGKLRAIHEGQLRLLTETECERLQGFPDGFTRYGVYDGEVREISRTQRYSLLGNAVSPPIVERVAARIKQTTLL